MKDEYLDLVDRDDKIVGKITRSYAHTNKLFIHREVVVCLFNLELSKTLLQKRGISKASSPGQWKITVAGHVIAGESPLLAAKRELSEELGISADLSYVGKHYLERDDLNESKFYWLYVGKIEQDTKLVIDPTEVEAAKWVNINNLRDFLDTSSTSYRYIQECHNFINKT